MTLSAPKIVGGVSTISTSVRLQGQIPGADVFVSRNGAPIGRKVANSFDEVFPFEPGTVLDPDDKITARQELGGDASGETPLPTKVQRLVPPHGGHRFISHVYRCGTSLFLGGIVPGAEVRLNVGAIPHGSAVSVDGGAVVELTSATGNGAVIEARQVIAGAPGPVVQSPPADEPPPLINFFVDDPRACAPGIIVRGGVDGAEVLVRTDAGDPASQRTFKVPVRNPPLLPLPALVQGQRITVQEVMRRCDLEGPVIERTVLPMVFERRPVIEGPLCAGLTRISLSAVVTGAMLVVRQGAIIVGQQVAYADKVDVWVSALAGGVDVLVNESLCGASIDSFPERVDPAPAIIEPCRIREPLVDCGMRVWIQNVHPGALVAAFSDQRGQISEWVRIPGKDGMVELVSALQAGHAITVVQVACGGAPVDSANRPTVLPVPALARPRLEHPVFLDRPYVRASDVQPGALVQLYAREYGYISQAIADWKGEAALPGHGLAISLFPGWHVFARQILCDRISPVSEPFEEVIDRTPLTPVIVAPPVGGTGVAKRPQLRWSDPGAGSVRAAQKYLVELTTPDHPLYDARVFAEVVTATDYTPAQDLAESGKFIWQVTANVGDPGFETRSAPAKGSFQVAAPPPPPPPPQPQGFSNAFLYNCNTDHRSVVIYKRDATLNEPWQLVQTLGAQYDSSGMCPGGGAAPVKIELTDGHWHQIVAVDKENLGCADEGEEGDPDTLACRRDTITVLGKKEGPAFNYSLS